MQSKLNGHRSNIISVFVLFWLATIANACLQEYDTIEEPFFIYNDLTDDSLEYVLITTPNLYAYYPKRDRFYLIDELSNSIQALFANDRLIIASEAPPYQDNFIHIYYLKRQQHLMLRYKRQCTYDGGAIDFYQYDASQNILEWGCIERPYRWRVGKSLNGEGLSDLRIEQFKMVEVQMADASVEDYDTLLTSGDVSIVRVNEWYGITVNSKNKKYPIITQEYRIEGF